MAHICVVRQCYAFNDPRVRRELRALLDVGHSVEVICTRGEELEVPIAELRRSLAINYTPTSQSSFRQAECGVIIDALKATSGRIAGKGGAAERLGLRRTTLQNKLRRLGISRAHYCH